VNIPIMTLDDAREVAAQMVAEDRHCQRTYAENPFRSPGFASYFKRRADALDVLLAATAPPEETATTEE
jgi:hypothetical protein